MAALIFLVFFGRASSLEILFARSPMMNFQGGHNHAENDPPPQQKGRSLFSGQAHGGMSHESTNGNVLRRGRRPRQSGVDDARGVRCAGLLPRHRRAEKRRRRNVGAGRGARRRRSETKVDPAFEIYRIAGKIRAKNRICPRSGQHCARAGRGAQRGNGESRRRFDLRRSVLCTRRAAPAGLRHADDPRRHELQRRGRNARYQPHRHGFAAPHLSGGREKSGYGAGAFGDKGAGEIRQDRRRDRRGALMPRACKGGVHGRRLR